MIQIDATTTSLQAKVWPLGNSGPVLWTVETLGSAPELQSTAGSFAIDLYNQSGQSHIFVDDVTIRRFPDPVASPLDPSAITMGRPRPHPVSDTTVVELRLPRRAVVAIRAYDAAGRLVRRDPHRSVGAGLSAFTWRAVDDQGRPLASGVYYLRVEALGEMHSQRIVVVR